MGKKPAPPLDPSEGTPLDETETQFLNEVLPLLREDIAVAVKELPYALLDRFIRGYICYKNRNQETATVLTATIEFRRAMQMETILNAPLPYQKEFYQAWPSYVFGTDSEGHLIVVDRIQALDIVLLEAFVVADLVKLRCQYQEAIEMLKVEIGHVYGAPRPKQVTIIDLAGLSMKHFSAKIRAILKPVLAVGNDNYPETVCQVWIVNSPKFFVAIWRVVSTWIDPITLKKIKILGGKDAYVKEFEKNGIEPSQFPDYMGGTHPGTSVEVHLERLMRDRGWDGVHPYPPLRVKPGSKSLVSGSDAEVVDGSSSDFKEGDDDASNSTHSLPTPTPSVHLSTSDKEKQNNNNENKQHPAETTGATNNTNGESNLVLDVNPNQQQQQQQQQQQHSTQKDKLIHSFTYLENRIAAVHRRASFKKFGGQDN